MGKTLVITEKASVARDIAAALGCSEKRTGYIEGREYIISWTVGHIAELYKPEDYDASHKRWSIDRLPIIPEQFRLKLLHETLGQYKVLEGLIRSHVIDRLICATDPGREGELIFRYVYILTGTNKSFTRIWLKSMNSGAIAKAFRDIRDGAEYNSLYHAAYARNVADWLVGYNASRGFSLVFGETLAIGRVQTPTLAIIVQREKEIRDFRPETFFTIHGIFGRGKDEFEATYKPVDGCRGSRIENQEEAERTLGQILDCPRDKWQVAAVQEDEREETPPPLYNLAELQKDANRLYGFSVGETLQIAQTLYERSHITYPRTDSRYLPAEMTPEVDKILLALGKTNGYGKYLKLITKGPKLSNVINDEQVSDHHAIIPQNVPERLSEDEFKVFDLIVRRFIAALMETCRYKTISAVIKNTGVPGAFLRAWDKEISPGWKQIDSGQEREQPPALKEGRYVDLVHAVKTQERTAPPERYTEGKLIAAMENAGRFVNDRELKIQLAQKGLGTSATRAAIIDKLMKCGYVVKDEQREVPCLVPTVKGMNLIDALDSFPEIKSPELTAKWEQQLDDIEHGRASHQEFLTEIKTFTCGMIKHCENLMRGKRNGKDNKTDKKSYCLV